MAILIVTERRKLSSRRAADHEPLTCEANEIVRPIHPKAMPVILTEPAEIELWLTAEWKEAKELQRPFPSDAMMLQPLERDEEAILI